MRIDKVMHGFTYRYKVKIIPNTMKCEVCFIMSDEIVIGEISPDFKYIILPDTYLSPYIADYGHVKVGKLKMNKNQQWVVRDYNNQ